MITTTLVVFVPKLDGHIDRSTRDHTELAPTKDPDNMTYPQLSTPSRRTRSRPSPPRRDPVSPASDRSTWNDTPFRRSLGPRSRWLRRLLVHTRETFRRMGCRSWRVIRGRRRDGKVHARLGQRGDDELPRVAYQPGSAVCDHLRNKEDRGRSMCATRYAQLVRPDVDRKVGRVVE